jgi:hypothetical protein
MRAGSIVVDMKRKPEWKGMNEMVRHRSDTVKRGYKAEKGNGSGLSIAFIAA